MKIDNCAAVNPYPAETEPATDQVWLCYCNGFREDFAGTLNEAMVQTNPIFPSKQ